MSAEVGSCTGNVEYTSFPNYAVVRNLTAHTGLFRWSSRFIRALFFQGTDKQASGTPIGDGRYDGGNMYRYLDTAVLIINAHVNQTLQRRLEFVHTNAIACMAE